MALIAYQFISTFDLIKVPFFLHASGILLSSAARSEDLSYLVSSILLLACHSIFLHDSEFDQPLLIRSHVINYLISLLQVYEGRPQEHSKRRQIERERRRD